MFLLEVLSEVFNMKKQNLLNNFIFQFLYQIVILVVPLILTPYLTRTLGSEALGVYSYVNSIAYYFVIFAMLGISKYGQRVISTFVDNEKELRKAFWSLLVLHLLISSAILVIYYLFLFYSNPKHINIYYIEGLYVASALFDITWFFYGIENFKSVVIKNILIRIFESISILLFVRTSSDISLYTFITASSILAGQAVMIPQAVKIAKPIPFTIRDIKQHIKPLLVFFVAVLAASLYTVFDKTLLGMMSSIDNVAYYEYSNKIINIPKTIISVIGTVMFPRACKLAGNKNNTQQKIYISYSLTLTSFIAMASMFGLVSLAHQFAIYYFGIEFAICGNIMIILSPIIYIIGIGEILRTQYMIPNNMDKEYVLSLIMNAIINLVISVCLIPLIGVYGAVLGTIAAEMTGLIYQLWLSKNFISIKTVLKSTIPFVIIGTIMFVFIQILNIWLAESLLSFVLKMSIGGLIYVMLSIFYMCRKHPNILNLRTSKK